MRDPLSRVQIKYKLPAAFVGVCLVAFGVGGYLISVSAGEALEQEILRRLRTESDAISRSLEAKLTLLGRRAEDFASDGFIRSQLELLVEASDADDLPGRQEDRARLLRHLRRNKFPLVQPLADLQLHLRDGSVLLAVQEADHGEGTARPAGRRLLTGNPAGQGSPVTEPGACLPEEQDSLCCDGFFADPETGRLRFALRVPVRDMELRRVLGSLVFHVDLRDWLRGEFASTDAHAVSIADRTGTRFDAHEAPPVNALIYAKTLPLAGWTLRVSADREEAMLPLSGLQSRFLGAGLLIGFAALVLLFFPVRFLIRPLSTMGSAARAIAEGDYSRRVEVPTDDEMGQLARSFNRMAEAVRERTEAMESSARQLEHKSRELAVERDLLTTVVQSMQDAVLYHDLRGNVVLHNRAAAQLGWDRGRDALHPLPRRCREGDPTAADCERCLRDSSPHPRECIVDIDDRSFEVVMTGIGSGGAPEGSLLVARDITHRIRMDARQAHRDRLAVLGEVSAVMAHELNNPLAAISLYAQMMRDELDARSEFHEHLEVVLRNTQTCKRTIRDLLTFARSEEDDETGCDLRALLPDVLRFLRPLYEKGDITLETSHQAGDARVACDEMHARQVVVNLVMNAVQALRGTGGHCRLRVFDVEGDRIGLDVTDDGPGIPDSLREQIFEPFFTSKPNGEGTGLGLSISRRLAEAHGGSLELLSSEPGRTVFRFVLPRPGTTRGPLRPGDQGRREFSHAGA